MSDRPGILLVHGMGRTPLSMALLAHRLRRGGLSVATFGYSAALEDLEPCLQRLRDRIQTTMADRPFLLVGHSLGSVLIRAVLPRLTVQPRACVFLAPPSRSPKLARRLAKNPIYRWLTGDMGQRLADPAFMDALPSPAVPVTVFAGDAGSRSALLPFPGEPNDGVVSVEEARLGPHHDPIRLPVLHTFIMNSRRVSDHVLALTAEALR
ncbi:MAG TPA: alpha/beta fold hydrolase [Holophagaceae bacterium]|nr:alpha/beta fold hydrolase [Holophagaceae bacterium]